MQINFGKQRWMLPQERLSKSQLVMRFEADSWFDTLMGGDVRGRREFIEENGRFVKNLDI